jgi:hypothetical protein
MPSPTDKPAASGRDAVRLDGQAAGGIFAAAGRQAGWGRDQFGYYTWVEHDDGHTYQIDVRTQQVAGCPDVQVTLAVITYRLRPDRDEPIGTYAPADTSRTLHQVAEASWCAQISQQR